MVCVSAAPTNREIAEQRMETYREKREARQMSIEASNERNYHLKDLFSSNTQVFCDDVEMKTKEDSLRPSLYQIKVTVCEELRRDLKLSGREKRGRAFIETTNDAVRSVKALRSELHAFFRALRKGTYLLSAGFPVVSLDGTVNAASTVDRTANTNTWPIETDEDVVETFAKADAFFASSPAAKRPAIVIQVTKDPNAPPPPPPPAYLNDMADPLQSTHMTMLSFYSFPAAGIANANDYATALRSRFKPFQALGRVYVAHEGINAQMSVPTNVLDRFMQCCNCLPDDVGTYLVQNGGINVDPVPLTRDEFAVAGMPVTGSGQPGPPFTNLHIRVRQQIVTDGLDTTYNWQDAGTSFWIATRTTGSIRICYLQEVTRCC